MISHRYKCIFLHIPKAAGTSIEKAFGHLDGHVGREGQDHRSLRMMLWPTVDPAIFRSTENLKEVVKATLYSFQHHPNSRNTTRMSRAQYRSYFKFTVVRNPWARAYSWYQNVLRDPEHQRLLKVDADIDFATFLRRFRGRGILKPQSYWLSDFHGQLPMDYICRFERLQDDFAEVCKRLGVRAITLPHELKGSGKGYADIYDDETRLMVEETYSDDIRRFGYVFGDKS